MFRLTLVYGEVGCSHRLSSLLSADPYSHIRLQYHWCIVRTVTNSRAHPSTVAHVVLHNVALLLRREPAAHHASTLTTQREKVVSHLTIAEHQLQAHTINDQSEFFVLVEEGF